MYILKPSSLVALTLFSALLLLPLPVMAFDETDDAETADDPRPDLAETRDQLMEEIVVVGEKSTIQLRHEIRAADMVVYEIFNELNTDDDYDIECRKQARIGSHILRTQCKARLYWEAQSELAEEDMAIPTIRPVANRARHERILREKVRDMAAKNPELLRAMLQREILKRELARRKEKNQATNDPDS